MNNINIINDINFLIKILTIFVLINVYAIFIVASDIFQKQCMYVFQLFVKKISFIITIDIYCQMKYILYMNMYNSPDNLFHLIVVTICHPLYYYYFYTPSNILKLQFPLVFQIILYNWRYRYCCIQYYSNKKCRLIFI